jgi:hypothetical protein
VGQPPTIQILYCTHNESMSIGSTCCKSPSATRFSSGGKESLPDQQRFGVGRSVCGIYIQRADSSRAVESESLLVLNPRVANGDQQRMFTLYGRETLRGTKQGVMGLTQIGWRRRSAVLAAGTDQCGRNFGCARRHTTPRPSCPRETCQGVKILSEPGTRGPPFRHDQRPHSPLINSLVSCCLSLQMTRTRRGGR